MCRLSPRHLNKQQLYMPTTTPTASPTAPSNRVPMPGSLGRLRRPLLSFGTPRLPVTHASNLHEPFTLANYQEFVHGDVLRWNGDVRMDPALFLNTLRQSNKTGVAGDEGSVVFTLKEPLLREHTGILTVSFNGSVSLHLKGTHESEAFRFQTFGSFADGIMGGVLTFLACVLTFPSPLNDGSIRLPRLGVRRALSSPETAAINYDEFKRRILGLGVTPEDLMATIGIRKATIEDMINSALTNNIYSHYSRPQEAEAMLKMCADLIGRNDYEVSDIAGAMRSRWSTLSRSTVNRRIAVWNLFVDYCLPKFPESGLTKLKYAPEDSKRIVFLNEKYIESLLKGADVYSVKHEGYVDEPIAGEAPHYPGADVWVRFMLYTGCRVSEASKLRWKDITETTVTFWNTKGGDNNARTLPLTRFPVKLLAWGNATKRLSEKPGPFSDYTNAKVSALWRDLRRNGYASRDHSPHTLRHTCASRMIQADVPLPVIKEWLGHRSLNMTLRYAHLKPKEQLERAATLVPPITAVLPYEPSQWNNPQVAPAVAPLMEWSSDCYIQDEPLTELGEMLCQNLETPTSPTVSTSSVQAEDGAAVPSRPTLRRDPQF